MLMFLVLHSNLHTNEVACMQKIDEACVFFIEIDVVFFIAYVHIPGVSIFDTICMYS